jgi:hypothetical protein
METFDITAKFRVTMRRRATVAIPTASFYKGKATAVREAVEKIASLPEGYFEILSLDANPINLGEVASSKAKRSNESRSNEIRDYSRIFEEIRAIAGNFRNFLAETIIPGRLEKAFLIYLKKVKGNDHYEKARDMITDIKSKTKTDPTTAFVATEEVEQEIQEMRAGRPTFIWEGPEGLAPQAVRTRAVRGPNGEMRIEIINELVDAGMPAMPPADTGTETQEVAF